jgi:hypothetical protein
MGLLDLFNKKQTMASSFEPLEKTVKAKETSPELIGKVEKDKAVYNLVSEYYNVDNLVVKTGGRLSDDEQKRLAQYDSILSTIITKRSTQHYAFGTPAKSKYDRGFMFREKEHASNDISLSQEERDSECKLRTKMAQIITGWIVKCGTNDKKLKDYVFNRSDSTFKDCSLADFFSAQARNMLTFGRAVTQIIRNEHGIPLMWRPLPAETIYRVIDGRSVSISKPHNEDQDVSELGSLDAMEFNALPKDNRPIAYVQRIRGKNVSFFTEDEIKIVYWQKQAHEGLNGYPLSPIELSYYTILMNFYAQRYLENAFTRGLGGKGVFLLKTPEGEIPPQEQIDNFRKLFSNYMARNDNSATIPIIAGPMDLTFIPLQSTPKDTEFDKLYARVIQTVCSGFQISPHELGFELDTTRATTGDSVKQEQIVQSEELGLKHMLSKLFDQVLEIVEESFPQAKGIFYIEPIGLGQNTKEADLAVYKEELQTSGTFGKIWADSERPESFPFGGNVPTSPIFHQNVAKYMKFSEMRFHFFGDQDAMDNEAYDFLCDPALDQTYQALKYKTLETQAKGQEMQLEAQGQQMEQAQQQADQPPPEPEQPEVDPNAEVDRAKQMQDMAIDKAQHDQKMKHDSENHRLNLRLKYLASKNKTSNS